MTVFDLDGTILDISERWYALHRYAATECGLPFLERESYISSKRAGIPEMQLFAAVSHDTERIERYCSLRVLHIEDETFLARDALFVGAREMLGAWKLRGRMSLLSLRHDEAAARREINRLGIDTYFESILFCGTAGKREHFSRIGVEHLSTVSISDSAQDYQDAKASGLTPLAVGYGTRSSEYLHRAGISQVIPDMQTLTHLAATFPSK